VRIGQGREDRARVRVGQDQDRAMGEVGKKRGEVGKKQGEVGKKQGEVGKKRGLGEEERGGTWRIGRYRTKETIGRNQCFGCKIRNHPGEFPEIGHRVGQG